MSGRLPSLLRAAGRNGTTTTSSMAAAGVGRRGLANSTALNDRVRLFYMHDDRCGLGVCGTVLVLLLLVVALAVVAWCTTSGG